VDLRVRVIGDISTGASRREAAEGYRVSPSVVVLWAQRFEQTGSVAAKPSGGSMDNVPVYKVAGVQEAIEAVGARAQRPSTNLTVPHEPRWRDPFRNFTVVRRALCPSSDPMEIRLSGEPLVLPVTTPLD